jgi:multidrug efflux pump subunit AcrB
MSGITRFAIDAPRLTQVFIVLVIVAGLAQFFTFPRQEDPAITIREVVISAHFPGMAPLDVEQLITRRIEEELRSLPEIDDIWSDSKTGVAVVHADTTDDVSFEELPNMWQRIRNRMIDLAPRLPSGTIGPFVNDEFGLVAVATIALWSDGFSMSEMRDAAQGVRDRLYELDGVRKVELWGVHEERVFLEFSTAKLAQAGVNIEDVLRSLVKQNVILPGGKYDIVGQDIILEASGNFQSVEDIENAFVKVPGTEQSIRVQDLLNVRRGFAEPAQDLAYYNGRRTIVVSVSITPGVNAVEFGERLKAKVTDLESRLPIGYVLEFATFQPDLVEGAVNGALNNVYQTLAIVGAVVMLFLGIRTGLIVGSFVPMTMLMGLVIMRMFGIELERISIASAIIALGMLVDNGIVIAEEIQIRLARGEERRKACVSAAGDLAVPLLTSSLTTILAFMPMLLLTGQTGEYAYSLPMVVTILLLSSWFLSMYMTPYLSFHFMRAPAAGASTDKAPTGGISGAYRSLLEALLRFRHLVLLFTLVVLAGGGYLGSKLVREMFGYSDRNQFLVYVDLPAGYNIDTTDEVVQRLGVWLADRDVNPEITGTIAYVGTGGPRFVLVLSPFDPDPNRAFLIVNTERSDQIVEVAERVRQHLFARFPEADARVKRMWTNGQDPGLVEIRLFGPDPEVLYRKGETLAGMVRAMRGAIDVRNNWENKVMKAEILVDQARARRAGVTSEAVANSLAAFVDGIQATDFREGDQAIPVLLRSAPEERAVGSDLFNIRVQSSRGGDVSMSQIADSRGRWEYSRIARRNQERALTVELKHERLKAPELLAAVTPSIEALALGEDYRWEVGGEIEQQAETMPKLARWLPHAGFLMVVLLIWQFNSYRRPAIIAFTLPLAFCGAFVGLVLFRAPFDFFGILGLLSLAGIIINNGIVLIDRIDVERTAGREPYDAVVEATVSRFRPICMTTITTLLGVMPLIISHDAVFYSMALIIGSGLVFGTVLTLGVVPVLYAVLFRVRRPATSAAA